jgi:hypothetical protein
LLDLIPDSGATSRGDGPSVNTTDSANVPPQDWNDDDAPEVSMAEQQAAAEQTNFQDYVSEMGERGVNHL